MSSQDLNNHTALALASSSPLAVLTPPPAAAPVRGGRERRYLEPRPGRADQSGTEQRSREIQLGMGRVL